MLTAELTIDEASSICAPYPSMIDASMVCARERASMDITG
jgi:hypothetical protein